MKFNFKLKYLLSIACTILRITIVFITFQVYKASTVNIAIYFTVLILIFSLIFFFCYLLGFKDHLRGVPFKHNSILWNTYTVISTTFFLILSFLIYIIPYLSPQQEVPYSQTQIIVDSSFSRILDSMGKNNDFTSLKNITSINICATRILNYEVSGTKNIFVMNMDFSEKSTAINTVYKVEILYLLYRKKEKYRYVLMEFNDNCKLISFTTKGNIKRIKELHSRGKQSYDTFKQYNYLKDIDTTIQ
jgi:hypothetical protein